MYYQNRDRDINYIKTRKDHCCYGMGLGIMVLDDAYPGFPGDVRNASAFPYPVQYDIVEGVNNYTLVGRVPGGAKVTKPLEDPNGETRELFLALRDPDFTRSVASVAGVW